MDVLFEEPRFAQPLWLAVGAVAALGLVALGAYGGWRRRRALERFAVGGRFMAPGVSAFKRGVKLALVVAGTFLLFVAAARPQWGSHFEQAERRGVDILFAVDTSRSMLADDIRPDRLTRAKLAVRDLVREFEGDRAGLVAFAGDAFLQCPMTLDRDVFERTLSELDPGLIPRGGTNISAAIREAVSAYGDVDHDKLLVLLTDGENLEGDVLETARWAADQGVRIFAVGVGTAEPTLLTVPGPDGRHAPVLDEHGQPVRSRLDEGTLRELAEIGDGAYEPLGADGRGLERIYARHLSHLPRHAVAARQHRVYQEGFQWPLGLGLLLLLLEPMIGERRWILRWRSRSAAGAAAAALALTLLFSAATGEAQDAPVSASAAETGGITGWLSSLFTSASDEAERAYRRGDYRAAEQLWSRNASAPRHRFNAGTAAYRAGDYERAEESLSAALQGATPSLQQQAYYNLGNVRYRRGEATLEQDREATKAAWRGAIESYESALALDGEDDDARHNLALVRRRLAALEEEDQQEQDSESQPQQCDNPSDGSQGGEQQSEGSQGGEQQSEGSQGGDESEGGQGDPQQSEGSQGLQQQSEGGQGEQQQSEGGQGEQQQSEGGQGQQQQSEGALGDDRPEPTSASTQDPDDAGDPSETRAAGDPSEEGGAETAAAPGLSESGEDPSGQSVGFAGSTGPGQPVGRLTREQALQLLRSLRTREGRYPAANRAAGGPNQTPVTRNW